MTEQERCVGEVPDAAYIEGVIENERPKRGEEFLDRTGVSAKKSPLEMAKDSMRAGRTELTAHYLSMSRLSPEQKGEVLAQAYDYAAYNLNKKSTEEVSPELRTIEMEEVHQLREKAQALRRATGWRSTYITF